MKYDAISVLGWGVNQKGEIPEHSRVAVKKAVALVKNRSADFIIFSGKWSYHSEVTFPLTEAEAMADYAVKLGLNKNKILIEKESEATATNICNVKRQILESNNWHYILIISLAPLKERIMENCRMILGPDYKVDFMAIDYRYPNEDELIKKEKRKMKEDVPDLFNGINIGDDETICKKAVKVINERRKNEKTN